MSLLDVLQRMFGSVALGIRDVFVGAVKAYKMEGEIIHVTPAKKTPERISELARRRAERDRHKEPKETSSIRWIFFKLTYAIEYTCYGDVFQWHVYVETENKN